MECPTITGLTLDAKDQEILEKIRSIAHGGELLKMVLPVGVFTTILLRSSAPMAAYNIQSTDWMLFAEAMTSLPPFVRDQISMVANMRRMRGDLSSEQREFWKAVAYGCEGY